MSTDDLITRLERLGIRLWVENDQLRYEAPAGVISNVQAELIQRKSEFIKRLLKAQETRKPNQSALRPVSRSGNAPLSFEQRRLWFLDQLEPGSSAYNMPVVLNLVGILDVDALEAALNALVARHETLRTRFGVEAGDPVQIIAAELKAPLPVDDLGSVPETEREAQLQKQMQSEADAPFDLAQGPLLRARLLKLGEQAHVLVLTLHHIIFDGWSMSVLMRELSVLYGAGCRGESSPLPALPIQYADYAIWQRDWLQGPVLEKELSYWREQLKDTPVLDLPTDRSRPATPSLRGAQLQIDLPVILTDGLDALSRRAGVTLFMTLLTAFQLLLQRCSGQDDIVVGSPIAGRNKVEVEGLIGFFVNTLVLRTDLSGNPTLMDLLGRVMEVALGAYSHQVLPFDKLVEELQPERDMSRNPLFDVMINLMEGIDGAEKLSSFTNLEITPKKCSSVQSKFTLTLYVKRVDNQLRLNLVYQADILDADRMFCMLQQFRYLLEQVVARPDQTIQSYSLVTPESRDLLPDPTDILDEPRLQTVIELLSATAGRLPGNAAISRNGTDWTYEELDKASLRLAGALRARGVESGDVVAVTGHRSFGLIVSILAVLKAGGIILPVDQGLPPGRQEVMFGEARARMLVQTGSDTLKQSGLMLLQVDAETGCLEDGTPGGEFSVNDLPDISTADPAYIFFTSGSTGVPKAVLGCHKSLSHFLCWQRDQFSIGPEDRVAQLTSLSFDVVLRDIFLPLISGGTLCLPDDKDLVKTLCWVEREGITVIHGVPTVTQTWLGNGPEDLSLRSLRWLFLAGEPLTDTLVRQWRTAFPESGSIVNLYGATEATLAKCFNQPGDEIKEGVQLAGNALPQTQALVLRHNRQLCGIGETGEIVIRTPFMTLGYLNNKEENRTRFVKNPFRDDERDILYYTGDRGRYRPDGRLEILGRFDDQVKIRGVRVEPAEVAAVLSRHDDVMECAVVARKDKAGGCSLTAYVVTGKNSSINAGGLRTDLGNYLQDAFIPSAFVFLERLPLLPNGKVDRNALPAANPESANTERKFVLPRTPVEKILAEVWQLVLGIQQVGIHDNFFELGGHSLLMTQVAYRVSADMDVDIPLADYFRLPTLYEFSIHVSEILLATMDRTEI